MKGGCLIRIAVGRNVTNFSVSMQMFFKVCDIRKSTNVFKKQEG